ncbi:hypothetical protein DFO70_101163 [Cytobacillus firmus]|uniref:Uncharacterized protein n=2 Tax=Cytobacillus TaxID=2675230 RepID=A0A366K5A4_CYTFI|nr:MULTISPECIES: hypothetical protein [Cytobacillus]RBP96358.1 hypothetical protein DFO70_101163 [Cytobacillus firmus]TDX45916.1 hypothetical protein DFO72_102394 [Cytobacillus oceanisediminis]
MKEGVRSWFAFGQAKPNSRGASPMSGPIRTGEAEYRRKESEVAPNWTGQGDIHWRESDACGKI